MHSIKITYPKGAYMRDGPSSLQITGLRLEDVKDILNWYLDTSYESSLDLIRGKTRIMFEPQQQKAIGEIIISNDDEKEVTITALGIADFVK